jgi:hypothetical protein
MIGAFRSRGRCGRIAGLAAIVAAIVAPACLIAEPSSDIPRLAPQRPHIVRTSVVPSAGAVLATFPTTVTVPVELSDPTLTFQYTVFVDYDPATNSGWLGSMTGTETCPQSTFAQAGLGGTARILSFDTEKPQDPGFLTQCHVIEVLVALQLDCGHDSNAAHSPPEPGGDSVTWFYSPSGDFSACAGLDAGLEASVGDGGQTP